MKDNIIKYEFETELAHITIERQLDGHVIAIMDFKHHMDIDEMGKLLMFNDYTLVKAPLRVVKKRKE